MMQLQQETVVVYTVCFQGQPFSSGEHDTDKMITSSSLPREVANYCDE